MGAEWDGMGWDGVSGGVRDRRVGGLWSGRFTDGDGREIPMIGYLPKGGEACYILGTIAD